MRKAKGGGSGGKINERRTNGKANEVVDKVKKGNHALGKA